MSSNLFQWFTEKELNKNASSVRVVRVVRVKETAPDQHVNFTLAELSESQKSLLRKGPSFAPTPSDINWYEVRGDFDRFDNQLRYRVTLPQR